MVKTFIIPTVLPKHHLPKRILQHCNVYKEARVKHASLFAWMCLSKYIDLNKVRFSRNGKPYLLKNTQYFSLSHSFDQVAIAIDKAPIGIDIDLILPLSIASQLAQRVLDKKDVKKYLAAKDQALWFTKYWTQHEAYFKMIDKRMSFVGLKEKVCGVVTTKLIHHNKRTYVLSVIKKEQ